MAASSFGRRYCCKLTTQLHQSIEARVEPLVRSKPEYDSFSSATVNNMIDGPLRPRCSCFDTNENLHDNVAYCHLLCCQRHNEPTTPVAVSFANKRRGYSPRNPREQAVRTTRKRIDPACA